MSMTVSRPIRIFALVALIAAVGGAAMLTLQKKHTNSPVVATTPPKTGATSHPSPSPSASTKPKTARPVRTATTPARKAPAPAVASNGLPTALDDALHSHKIVVVSVFDPQSSTDAISYAEAKAGAGEAGAGFVGVSVLDNPVAGALTSLLPGGGLLPEPGVLVYRRPGTLVQLINGFADRDVVAQAAASSATAPPLSGSGS
jgi:hypothetical protein